MSFTFDPYSQSKDDVQKVDDVLMTNPTALQELEAYWRSLPRTRGVPNRRDVDPSNMAALLEDSFVLERGCADCHAHPCCRAQYCPVDRD